MEERDTYIQPVTKSNITVSGQINFQAAMSSEMDGIDVHVDVNLIHIHQNERERSNTYTHRETDIAHG